MDSDTIRDLAESQIVERKARLSLFTDLHNRYKDWPEHQHPLATLKAGQMLERASIAFWREIAESADTLASHPIVAATPAASREALRKGTDPLRPLTDERPSR